MRLSRVVCRSLAVLACTGAMAGAASAGVFKCKGPDGTLIFQDSACCGHVCVNDRAAASTSA